MSKAIKHTDVKVGDTIRVTRDYTVTHVARNGFGTTVVRHDGPGVGKIYLRDEHRVELLDRPLELPTEFASFVEVTLGGATEGKGHWLLTEHLGHKVWVSATRSHMTPTEFKAFLAKYNGTIEVIR